MASSLGDIRGLTGRKPTLGKFDTQAPWLLDLKPLFSGNGQRLAEAHGIAHQASIGGGGLVKPLPFDFGRSRAQPLQQPIAARLVLFTPVVVTLVFLAAVFEKRDAQAIQQGQHRQ